MAFYSADHNALMQWFQAVDTDRSGSISATELQRALSQGGLVFSLKLVSSMVRRAVACFHMRTCMHVQMRVTSSVPACLQLQWSASFDLHAAARSTPAAVPLLRPPLPRPSPDRAFGVLRRSLRPLQVPVAAELLRPASVRTYRQKRVPPRLQLLPLLAW